MDCGFPKADFSVASHSDESAFSRFAGSSRDRLAFRPKRLREHLRHNNYQTTVLNSRTAGQRLHTDRTYWTLHNGNQTISPKLETIATALICVKAGRFVT